MENQIGTRRNSKGRMLNPIDWSFPFIKSDVSLSTTAKTEIDLTAVTADGYKQILQSAGKFPQDFEIRKLALVMYPNEVPDTFARMKSCFDVYHQSIIEIWRDTQQKITQLPSAKFVNLIMPYQVATPAASSVNGEKQEVLLNSKPVLLAGGTGKITVTLPPVVDTSIDSWTVGVITSGFLGTWVQPIDGKV